MQWLVDVQDTFDASLDGMDNLLDVQDENDMMNDVEEVAAGVEEVEEVAAEMEVVAEMEEVPEVAAEMEVVAEMEKVEKVDAEMNGQEVHQFDVPSNGEQVIFDVMFDIHHPKNFLDDNGIYCYREE
jgi:hypothetical protein